MHRSIRQYRYLIWVAFFVLEISASIDIPLNKWKVDSSSWNTSETPHEEQLAHGMDIIYSTMFLNFDNLEEKGMSISHHDYLKTIAKGDFIKRLYVVLAEGNLEYTHLDNNKSLHMWPFVLSSALTQGQRIMIILDGISYVEFLDFLTNENRSLFYKRNFSSHGVKWSKKNNWFEEIKIKSSLNFFSKTEGNLGMDVALGGVGNFLPNNSLVYVDGQEFSQFQRSVVPNTQLGHFLVYWKQFSFLQKDVLLIGLEGCAPGKKNLFGCSHNIFSGFYNQRAKRSSTGGSK